VIKENSRIRTALISVYHKSGLDSILDELKRQGVIIYSTGGTYSFLEEQGIRALKVEDLTGYPSILGGRVKTLHPKVFGAILGRRDEESDIAEMQEYDIPEFDLVIVDLYPFEETRDSGGGHAEIIEKIDIGGISLIRAAAKNYNEVLVIPSQSEYIFLEDILLTQNGESTLAQRKEMAATAFAISSDYDSLISDYLSEDELNDEEEEEIDFSFENNKNELRYGENPHQKAFFHGSIDEAFEWIQGKELSFNNLVDIDAAINLVREFDDTVFCIIKHTNPCGVATGADVKIVWLKALAADNVSAFGGIFATNGIIHSDAAQEIDKIFFEVCIAPDFTPEAVEILSKKKNRILLKLKSFALPQWHYKSVLNGILQQEFDNQSETTENLKTVTVKQPGMEEVEDMLFANKIVKHAKSNAIVLVKDKQLIGIGVGQTSRVDALKQAVAKAKRFGFSTEGSVMASDAFFPFVDCVEIADEEGIKAVIQPGGSIRDQDSIDYCNAHGMAMVTTGYRHFKH